MEMQISSYPQVPQQSLKRALNKTEVTQDSFLLALPIEVKGEIFSFLAIQDVLRYGQTSKMANGEIPQLIACLDIQVNNLTQDAVVTLLKAELLRLSVSCFAPEQISFIAQLTNLKTLSIEINNNLTQDAVATLLKAESLQLSAPNVAPKQLPLIAQLTNLKILSLFHSKFEDGKRGLGHFTQLNQLHTLNIERAWFSSYDGVKALAPLTNLTSLNVDGSDLHNGLEGLKKLTGLVELNLAHTAFPKISQLTGLTKLRCLNMDFNEAKMNGLENLVQLEHLNLANTKFSNTSLLKDLTNLQSLDLTDGEIEEDELLRDLTKLTNLLDLNLDGIDLTDDGAQQLEDLLPNTNISW